MNQTNEQGDRQSENEQIRDRAVQLFTFLKELTRLRVKTIRSSDHYEKVIWLHDIPEEPESYCITRDRSETEERSDIWIRVKKPKLKPPPDVPEILQPWMDLEQVKDSSLEMPELRERYPIEDHDELASADAVASPMAFKELGDEPKVKSAWERYIEKRWWPWAEVDRRLQAVQRVYNDLFSIYQKQQRLGEAYEVVLGLGYLTWRVPSGQEVKRHIVTARTNLTFDATRGVITLGPAPGEGAKPTLEQDMLEPNEQPHGEEQKLIEQGLEEIGDDVWTEGAVEDILRMWVHAVSPMGEFDGTVKPQTQVEQDPRIHLAPAVILRKRGDRTIVRVFEEIISQLQGGRAVPIGVKRLVTIMDDLAQASGKDKPDWQEDRVFTEPDELYFPLQANEEQKKIAEQLAVRQGVLVQGPPGTGKSHTIVNLICHLLARGQRVLVTSHTARALRVLGERIPKEVAALCVMLLGDDRMAIESLEDSVRGITDRYYTWNPEESQDRTDDLIRFLDQARKQEASVLNELRAIREKEVYKHPPVFGDYAGTAESMARRLREEEPSHNWLTVKPEEDEEPPLTDEEAVELLRLLRDIDDRLEKELGKTMVEPELLIDPEDFARLVEEEKRAQSRYDSTRQIREHRAYPVLRMMSPEQRQTLRKGLGDLATSYDNLSRHHQEWARMAARDIMVDRDRQWRDLLSITREHLSAVGERARAVSERQISGLDERDRCTVRAHAESLLEHLKSGGRLGFGPFRPKTVKKGLYLIKEIHVDGYVCDRPEALVKLIEWIDVVDRIDILRTQWSVHTEPPEGPVTTQVAEYQDLCEPLEKALELYEKVACVKKLLVDTPAFPEPIWHDLKSIRALEQAAEAVALEEEAARASAAFESLEESLQSAVIKTDVHPTVSDLFAAVRGRSTRKYAESFQALRGVYESKKKLHRRRGLLERLELSAPDLTAKLTSDFREPVWDQRMSRLTSAWNWIRADRWLRRMTDPESQERLLNGLASCRGKIRDLIRDLASAKAWGHCFSRLTEHERAHLIAWTKTMKKIGKGTGKYAPMHRRAARENMEECRSAIPAWVMPIYRVAETFSPGTDVFDVAIVDEASQSGPEALFLHYMAKKMVVVGDDEQIKPDYIGAVREDVELLRQRHIPDIPLSPNFGFDDSFFDQADIRYAGRIRLVEHFRCMPEIIQFSNDLCYRSKPLEPLRQYGTNRLEPAVIARHVPDGYQKGRSPRVINPPEVEAIVEQIKACCGNRAYEGKSLGVISLLGENQAREIERLLLEQIGPEEMEKRQLLCGDAYAFQGDERDIMFLSLVSAPTEGHVIATLTGARYKRRFNVAASRAKDQLWLFHSATLNDLSPRCFRYRLLSYCQNPKPESDALGDLNLRELSEAVRDSERNRQDPPLPFESWFEFDVFLRIASRG